MTAFYNENSAYPAQWTRNLIEAGHIAPGVVDERSISDLPSDAVRGACQFHAFAGYGTWSHALRLAGVSDETECWTGSPPCQPFSQAGQGKGFDDERHLWPAWYKLIKKCHPPVLFGEEVGSPAGMLWFEFVRAELEAEGYAVGGANLPAASVGAPHIRQRLFFVADSTDGGWSERARRLYREGDERASELGRPRDAGTVAYHHYHRCEGLRSGGLPYDENAPLGHDVNGCSEAHRLGYSSSRSGRDVRTVFGTQASSGGEGIESGNFADESFDAGAASNLADNASARCNNAEDRGTDCDDERPGPWGQQSKRGGSIGELGHHHHHQGLAQQRGQPGVLREASRGDARQATLRAGSPVGGFWSDAEWIPCTDGKWRPAKRGAFPLAYGDAGNLAPPCPGREEHRYNRTGALKAIGNAIVPQVAATFIRAFIECTQHP